ncbi:MAG: pyridine nucleotide-disulfide oxidoreductase [Burkholderiales bacterium]|nr:MAG: pyridine nucleotide-disulfide oxidoreductase [Burkholderiales bacterium]
MKRLLLVGAGHAHAQVLKDWVASPLGGTELVIVSPRAQAPYSGMVPGWLAGFYRFDEICIDFVALARAAGAHLVADEAAGIDPERRQLRLRSGAALDYDLASLNVGSTLTPPRPPGVRVLSLRPLGRLHDAWEELLAAVTAAPRREPLQVTAVGGGAAGVESLLAALARLRALLPQRSVHGTLVALSDDLLPGMSAGAARAVRAALAAAGVTLRLGTVYDPAAANPTDVLLWATGAEAHDWPRASGLSVGPGGFVRIDRRLRSVSHPEVYAAGDCAEWAEPLPKAGVYAVRMGPVLSRNLRAALGAGGAIDYVPQRRFLALLATADGSAVASWGRWSAHGRWAWRWKDRIDRGFVRRFA